jgi:hypothetical protein
VVWVGGAAQEAGFGAENGLSRPGLPGGMAGMWLLGQAARYLPQTFAFRKKPVWFGLLTKMWLWLT